MKKIVFLLIFCASSIAIHAQKATVIEPDGVTTPRLTTAQRTALTAEKGKVVFDTNTNSMWYHDGSNWQQISSTGNSNLWNSSGQNIFYSNIDNINNAAIYSNATNYPIPDESLVGVTSNINMPLIGEVINPDLITISFSIAHTYAGDLKIILIMPNGAEFVLVNRFGNSDDYLSSNIISINKVALGPLIKVGGAIPTGTYIPTESAFGPVDNLGNLVGLNVNGDWGLKIQDLSSTGMPGGTGSLVSWSISLESNCIGTVGNVGIGKNNPSERLDVDGNVKISRNISVLGHSTVSGNSFFNSKVGIGTTTPNGLLQFGSQNKRQIVLYEAMNNDHQFSGLGSNYGTMKYQISSEGYKHVFSTGTGLSTSTDLMTIEGTGDVGIGIGSIIPPSSYGSGGSNRILEIHNDAIAGQDKQSQVVLSSNGTSGFLGGITWASKSLSGEKRTGFIGNVFTSTNGTKLSFWNRSTAGALIENFIIRENGSATLVGALTQNSDVRLKTNINHLVAPLSSLSQLNGYSYHWKDKTRENSLQYGLLAQEVQKIYPNLVKEDENGMLSVNYIGIIPILIEAVKELTQKNQNLEIRLLTIETMLENSQPVLTNKNY